jgi:hypothetical protein
MNMRTILWIIATAILSFVWTFSWAQSAPEPYRAPLEQLVSPPGEPYIYGWQLMTGAERDLMHERLRRAQTEEERQQIHAIHHQQMQGRAKQMGYTLPEGPRMHNQAMQMRQPIKKQRRNK